MKTENDYKADVVIIGGGIAGIVTALELLDRGKKVLILDRDAREHFGGQAVTAFGGMMLTGTPLQKLLGIKDTPEIAFSDWCETAQFSDQDILPRQWAELYCHRSYEDIYRWVRSKGIGFLPSVMWPERGYLKTANSLPRYHIIWGTGQELTTRLIHHLYNHKNKQNLTLLFEHRVTGLIKTKGVVTGCGGRDLSANRSFTASGGGGDYRVRRDRRGY